MPSEHGAAAIHGLMSRRVGVFHPGSQHAWQPATAFQDAGALAWHATSAYFHPESVPVRMAARLPGKAGQRLRRRLLRRYFPRLDPARIRRMGVLEFLELALMHLRRDALARRVNVLGNRRFGQGVIALMKREPVDMVWGFDTSSLEVFRWAKARGVACVLDQTIGHPAAMNARLKAERERHPEFFRRSYEPFSPAWIDRQNAEMDLADVVVCGSRFAAATMIEHGCDPTKIRVIPYGYDEALWPTEPPARPPLEGRPLELLFAGRIGPRKGLARLLPAIAEIPESVARLTLIGRTDIPDSTFERYRRRVRHIPHVPREEIAAHFRAADCFVFPSLFEGSALVLNEAVGAGLGLIQSRAAGEGAWDGENGIVLEEPSVEAIAQAIHSLHRDRGRLGAWQRASWRRRGERAWARYRDQVRRIFAP